MVKQVLRLPVNTTVTASGDTTTLAGTDPDGVPYQVGLGVGACSDLAVDVTFQGFSGGTSPTAVFNIDRLGLDGLWYPIATSQTFSAAGVWSTTLAAQNSQSQSFGQTVRLRWTLTGTPTNAKFSASIIGK